jgi:hypothetical protein
VTDDLRRHHAKVLRPEDAVPAADGEPVESTVYRYDSLLVFGKDWDSKFLGTTFGEFVTESLRRIGIEVIPPPQVQNDRSEAGKLWQLAHGELEFGLPRLLRLRPLENAAPTLPLDAWRALQHLRFEAGRADTAAQTPTDGWYRERADRVSLEHVLWSSLARGDGEIFGLPGVEGHGGGDLGDVGPGRMPVRVLAGPPPRTAKLVRRPVVAVLDTPVGPHDWLPMRHPAAPATDYVVDEWMSFVPTAGVAGGRLTAPLIGSLDSHAGHGTYIAGIVRQVAPDATVLSIPVMHNDGLVDENSLQLALGLVLGRVVSAQKGGSADQFVDVVLLSLGFYSATPHLRPMLWYILNALTSRGVAVVASAGNDATSRRCYPAAWATDKRWSGPLTICSVGALNPNGTRAIFSNQDDDLSRPDWVTAWEPGVAIVSTFPKMRGSRSAALKNVDYRRESFDPDDFSHGFGLWRGTSFAAAVKAAKLARDLLSTSSLASVDQRSTQDRMLRMLKR